MKYSKEDLKTISYHLALAEFKKSYYTVKTREQKLMIKKAIEDLEGMINEINGLVKNSNQKN